MKGLPYSGAVMVLLIDADGHETTLHVDTVLEESMPGLYALSSAQRLPVQSGTQIRVTLADGQNLSGAVGYVSDNGLTFSRPRGGA